MRRSDAPLNRAALAGLAALLALSLAPIACVAWRSLEVVETVARPGDDRAPDERAARLVAVAEVGGVAMATFDAEELRTMAVEAWQADALALRTGERVAFLPRRGGGDVWREPPAGQVGVRFGTVTAVGARTVDAPSVAITVDEERTETARWDGPAGAAPGTHIAVREARGRGLRHYATVLGGARQWGLLMKSVALALGAAALAFAIGFPLGILTARTDLPGARWLGALYVAPLLVPTYVAAIGWARLLGAAGVLTAVVRGPGAAIRGTPLLPIYGLAGSIVVMGFGLFPLVTLCTRVACARTDPAADEAGLLVASPGRVLVRGVARAVLPAGLAGATFAFLFALSAYGAPSLLRFVVFSEEVFSAYQARDHLASAAATATPLVLVALVALAFLGRFERGRAAAVASALPAPALPLGRMRPAWALAAWGVLALAVGVPLLGLVWQTQTQGTGLGAFTDALGDMRREFRHSVATAAMTTAWTVAVALPLGWFLGRGRWREGGGLDLLLLLPFAFPAAVTASGMIEVWNRPGPLGAVYASPAYLALALGIRCVPFAVRPVALAARELPRDAVDAARLSGASGWTRARRLWLPMLGPGAAAGAVLVFILALGDLDTTLLASTPGWETLQVRIFNAIHFGREWVVCAACLLLVGLCTIPLAIYALLLARRPKVL